MSSSDTDARSFKALILDPVNPEQRRTIDELLADPHVQVVDVREEVVAGAGQVRGALAEDEIPTTTQWAYFPWRRAIVRVLNRDAFDAVRLDRNRNQITAEEQRRLRDLRIGIVGLSVGHVVAHTLAMQGLCGHLRLADFDDLELSNLNRVPATLFDLGLNKAVAVARRISELDPYLDVEVLTSGISPASADSFLDGVDILIEECDSLDIKLLVREAARRRGIPVLMATSDRGLMDVERFDIHAERPILHGLVGQLTAASLAGLTSSDKVPHVLRILDGAQLSARTAASLVEVGSTLRTWPQLAGEVVLGASIIAEAVRRIGLAEPLPSGRLRVDLAAALHDLDDPLITASEHHTDREGPVDEQPTAPAADIVGEIVEAAARAPSGGNSQPWQIRASGQSIHIHLIPAHTSAVDIGLRSSAAAVGAALFNARVAAAFHKKLGPVSIREEAGSSPLSASIDFADGDDPELATLHQAMLARETNRHLGSPEPLGEDLAGRLESVGRREGARLKLLASRAEIEEAADILAAADRIRYLTPRLHAEFVQEIRWPGDPSPDTGLDVRALALDPEDLAVLEILQRPDVMTQLARWDAGGALGDYTRDRVRASSAVGVVVVDGQTLTDYARGGSAAEAIWITAQQSGMAVHPVSPLFLNARDAGELQELSKEFAPALSDLQQAFYRLTRTGGDESHVIVLRFAKARSTQIRSRRRTNSNVRLPLE